MKKSHFIPTMRHHVLLCGIVCLWLLTFVGCGRPDVPTSATEPTAVEAVAEPTVIGAAAEPTAVEAVAEPTVIDNVGAEPLPSATGAAYPVPTTGEVIAVAGPIAVDYPAPELGIVIDAQNQVVDVPKGGAADEAGVQVGDTLIALDDMPFAKEKDKIKQHVSRKEKGAQVTLTLKRNGKEKKLKLKPNTVPSTLSAPDAPTPTPIPASNDLF